MGVIGQRKAAELAAAPYDIIIVGGGIHGAMLHLEASRRGLESLLVERGDFGGETSLNTLRIVHGGLRYLQRLDLARCIESAREQQWYLEHMRGLVEPLPCLLPLDGRGLKRGSLLRIGLALNALVSAGAARTAGLSALPRGRIVRARDAAGLLPASQARALRAAALWTDLRMPCPSRILIETLRWAAALGGTAVNFVEAAELRIASGRVRGITAENLSSKLELELDAPIVVNAAGPAVAALQSRWDRDRPALFHPVAAWNVLFDRPALSDHALAVRDPRAGRGSMLFATALDGRLMIGTGYASLGTAESHRWRRRIDAELDGFIATVNAIVPELALDRRAVLRVYAGLLPATRAGSEVLRARALVHDHGEAGGPAGLLSVSGTKFTTARAASIALLRRLRSARTRGATAGRPRPYPRLPPDAAEALELDGSMRLDRPRTRAALERIIAEEAVEHLDDLVLRRTAIGDDPVAAWRLARDLCALHEPWRGRRGDELARLRAALIEHGVPAGRLAWPRSDAGELEVSLDYS